MNFSELLPKLKEAIEQLEWVLQNLDLFEEQRRLIQDEMSLESQTSARESMAGPGVVGYHVTQQLVDAPRRLVSDFALLLQRSSRPLAPAAERRPPTPRPRRAPAFGTSSKPTAS
jgi:homospermidine synthase